MAIEESEFDAVWDAAPVPEPTAEDLEPLLDRNPVSAEDLDAAWEDDELEQDARVRTLFEVGLSQPADLQASVHALSKETGLAPDVVARNFGKFRQAAEVAKMDARRFRKDNPEFAEWAAQNPHAAGVVFRDKQPNLLQKALGKIAEFGDWLEAKQGPEEPEPPVIGFPWAPGEPTFRRPTSEERAATRARAKEEAQPKLTPMVEDPLAKAQGLDRLALPLASWRQAGKQHEYARTMGAIIAAKRRGDSTAELEALAEEQRKELVARDYGQGVLGQTVIDATEAISSQLEVFRGAGPVAIGGAAVGGAIGAAVGKSAEAARKGAGIGFRLAAPAGVALASYELEVGPAYAEIRQARTDDGRPIDDDTAIGAARMYAILAASIETVSFGAQAEATNPLLAAIKGGTGKRALRDMLRDPVFRATAKRVGQSWMKAAATEGAEESLQELTQEVSTWLAKTASAGEAQRFDVQAAASRAYEAGVKGAVGGVALHPAFAGIQATARALDHERATRAAKNPGAIVEHLKGSPAAQAAPEAVAKAIQRSSDASHVYVDPAAVLRFFQDQDPNADPLKGAEEVIGADAVRRLQEAVATGQKLDVPMAEFVQRWAPHPVGAAVADHATTRSSTAPSTAELQDREAQAQAIAKAHERENPPPVTSEAEKRLVDVVERQLARAGPYDAKQAATAISLIRSALHAQAVRFGTSPDELFDQYVLTVEAGRGGETPAAALAQPPEPDTELDTPGASQLLADRLSTLDAGARAAELYLDPVSGLRNRKAFDATPAPPGKQVAVITSPDIKAVNDEPAGGHDTANEVLRAIGSVVGQFDPEAARSGTNFLFYVEDEAKLRAALERIQQALPEGLVVEGALGATTDEAFRALDASTDAKRRAGTLPQRGKTAFDLTKLPELQLPEGRAAAAVPAELVEAVGKLTDEAFFREAYQDRDVPGILSKAGWEAVPRKRYVAALDLRGLKRINERLGKEVGDQLLGLFGEAAQHMGGGTVDFAHLSGDEYAAQHDDPAELQAFLEDLRAELKRVGLPHTLPDGRTIQLHADFRDGIAEGSYGAADRALNARKRAEAGGSAVGDGPDGLPGSAREAPGTEGRQDDGDNVRRDSRLDAGRKPEQRRGAAQGFRHPRRGEKEGPLEQRPAGAEARGFVEFATEGAKRIMRVVLNPNADLSTFLHESGHVFLEVLGDLAERADAPTRAVEDYAAVLKWLGVESRGAIKREQHEKFARGFEAYLFEGKAPSPGLARAFARFAVWLKSVYRSIASLNVELSDEIRGVFDRLLATDEEIARARRAMRLEPMFRSPAEAGMSPERWQEYLGHQEQAASHASRTAELRVLKDKLRESESWWKQQESTLRGEVGREYDARTDVRALRYIKRGEILVEDGRTISDGQMGRMDRAVVEEMIGAAAAKRLFGGRLIKEGGEHPDAIAELFRYPTGRELLAAVAAVPEKDAWVKGVAAQRMRERHPEILEDTERMRELVGKGLHGDHTAKWLVTEWRALRAKSGAAGAPPVEAIRRAAVLIAQRQPVRTLGVHRAYQAEGAAADKAMRAAAAGDYAEAYVFKQQQLLNHFLFAELQDAREQRDAFLELASELRKDKSRARLGKASPAIRDAVDTLLEALELREPLERDEQPASLDEAIAVLEALGSTIMFDAEPLRQLLARPKGYRQLTVAEMANVVAALKNLRQGARNRNTALVEGKRVDREEVVAELVAEALKNLPSRGPLPSSVSAETAGQTIGRYWNAFSGELLKPETLVGWLGGDSTKSTWFRAVIQPLQEAKAREVGLLQKAIAPIVEAFENVPTAVRSRFQDSIDGAKLFPNHKVALEQNLAPPSRRFELLMMALNAGSQSNLDRLLEGRNITEQQLSAAIDSLTKEELDWVQAVWDAAESLWPEARALEERDSGLAPPKVEPRPLVTRHGTYRGGYFPAVYDRRVEAAGERQATNAIADLLDQSYTRPGTSRGHLKSRAEGFTGALSLEPATISRHLAQVAHDIAFREAIKSVGGLVLAPQVRAVLVDRLGDKTASQFLPWLKDVGQMRGVEGVERAAFLLRWARAVRANTVVSALGYAIPNAIEDLSNLPAAIARTELKARYLAGAVFDLARAPIDTFEFATSKSGELRTRHHQLQRELAKQVQQLVARGPAAIRGLRWLKDHAFVFMEFSDKATSTPVWLGAYRQALANKESESAAVTFADSIVRKVFPSHSPVDAAPILRDKGVIGMTLMFYGFLNTYANGLADLAHQLRFGSMGDRVKVGARLLAYVVAVSVLSEFLRGRGKEEGEEWQEWFLRKFLTGPLTAFPVGGDVANLIEGKLLGKKINPRNNSIIGVSYLVGEAVSAAANEAKDPEKRVEAVIRALGPTIGLPASQPIRTGRYLFDLAEGDLGVRNPADVASGLIYGEREDQPANPFSIVGGVIAGE